MDNLICAALDVWNALSRDSHDNLVYGRDNTAVYSEKRKAKLYFVCIVQYTCLMRFVGVKTLNINKINELGNGLAPRMG